MTTKVIEVELFHGSVAHQAKILKWVRHVIGKAPEHTELVRLLKGGIPAAPSGTATLLRLSPSYQFYLR